MKRATCAILLMIICSLVSACTIGNVNIVFEEEQEEAVLFSLGEYGECTEAEMVVYFLLAKTEYEEVFGEDVWQLQIDDISMEDFVKNNILTQALEEKSMSALAELKGLVLTEEEAKEVKRAAEELHDSFFKGKVDESSIEVKDIESVLTDKRLSEMAFEYITKDVDSEISDAEAKVITVQYIKCDLQGKVYSEVIKLMEEIHSLLITGNFDTVSARYEAQTESATIDVCKGEILNMTSDGEALESKLFALADGELSEVITVGNEALYIFKSVNDYDPDKTEDNKAVILNNRKNAIMQKEYEAFIESVEYTFDEEMWESLHFDEYM